MAIPNSQLETWSNQGSITQSASTYASIKNALEHDSARYTSRNFEVFLQGSYGNDTNIYSESDVDVVIRYDGAFYHDLTELPPEQLTLFHQTMSDGTYPYDDFKNHAKNALIKAFPMSVVHGKKAIRINENGTRRSADVIPAFGFRRYYRFNGSGDHDQNYDEGICFWTPDGKRIINYPKKHSANSTTKHQSTSYNFKPLVRIFKNIRTKLVDDGSIGKDIAPSYFIEGLLYNAPNELFRGTYQDMVANILRWFQNANLVDRAKFVCVNDQYYLFHDSESVCWPQKNAIEFVTAVQKLSNNWR